MRSRYLAVTVLSAIVFAAIMAPRAASSLRSVPEGSIAPLGSSSETVAERVDVQIEERLPVPATVEAAVPQGTRVEDGRILLEGHCSQCHTTQMLEQTEQSRTDWEKSLAKMEGFGVRLDATEKAVLLDYLAGAEQQ